jgi:tetratricopeptide (TPR) repeat protein
MLRYDFFISYASEDIQHARELTECLRKKRYDVFLDEDRIRLTTDWPDELDKALRASHVTVVLYSEHSSQADWQKKEITLAVELAKDPAKHKVTSVLFPGCDLPLSLINVQSVICKDPVNWQKIAEDLLKGMPELQYRQPWFPPYPAIINQSKLVELLRDKIRAGSVIILTGQHGTGKSSVAEEAAYKVEEAKEIPGGKVWIDCKPDMSLEQCLFQIMRDLTGDYPGTVSQQDIKDRIIAYCRENGRALIVLDEYDAVCHNAEFPTWLNGMDPCVSVLLTARIVPDGLYAPPPLPVDPLSPQDAAELVARQAKAKNPDWQDEDSVSMERLCREVGNQPSVLKELGNKAAWVPLKDLCEHWRDIFPPTPGDTDSKWQRAHHEVFLRDYAAVSPNAQKLLRRLGVFANGVAADIIGQITQGGDWLQSVPVLGNMTLCQHIQGRYVVEPLHQLYIKEMLGDTYGEVKCEMARRFLKIAVAKGKGMSPSARSFAEKMKTLDWFEAEWENLKDFVKIAWPKDAPKDVRDRVCELSDQLCDFFFIRGHTEECRKVLEKVLEIRDSDSYNEGLVRTLRSLGLWYEDSDYPKAHKYYLQSFHLARELGDQESEARALYGLACAQFRIAQAQGAADRPIAPSELDFDGLPPSPEEMFARSIDLLTRPSSEIYRGIALAYRGTYYMDNRRWEDAEKDLTESRKIMEKWDDKVGEGIQLLTLGNLYLKVHKFPESEDVTRQSIEVFTNVRDRPKHFEVCRTLAHALFWQGKWDEAERKLEEARSDAAGLARPLQEIAVNCDLGRVYMETGRWREAEELFTASIDACSGPCHDAVRKGVARRYLSSLYALQHQWSKAKKACQEAIETCKATREEVSLSCAHCSVILTHVLCEGDKSEHTWREYDKRLKECNSGLRSMKEQNHFDWANALRAKARVLQLNHNLQGAEEAYRESLGHLRKRYSSPWNTAQTLLGLAEVCREAGDYRHSEDYYEESREIFKDQGVRFQEGRTLVGLAKLRRDQGRIPDDVYQLASQAALILENTEDSETLEEARQLQGAESTLAT